MSGWRSSACWRRAAPWGRPWRQGIGAGVFPDAGAIDRFLRVEDVTEPDPGRAALYADLTDRLEQAYLRLRGFA